MERQEKIKYTFYLLMSFYFIFHFLFPVFYYFIYGFNSSYNSIYFDKASLFKGVSLNFLSLLIGTIFIRYIPTNIISNSNSKKYRSKLYLISAIIFSFGAIISKGSYADSLKSLHQPSSILIWGNMFINLDFYFLFSLVSAIDFLAAIQIIYVIKCMLGASRSASLSLTLFLIYSFWSQNVKIYLKKYLLYLVVAISLTFFTFNWATSIRSQFFTEGTSISEKFISSFKQSEAMRSRILGRISFLEISMLPILHKDHNLPNLQIFYEKYSIFNQFKLIINNIVPGNAYPDDALPNQYYRSAFLNMPLQIAKENYTSINMTIPVYFYMYCNFWTAVFITGFIIWIYYVFTLNVFRFHPLAGSIFIYFFYSYFLSYFDFVSLIKFLVIGFLAVPIFIVCSNIERYLRSFGIKIK